MLGEVMAEEKSTITRKEALRNCITVVQNVAAVGAAIWAICWWFMGRDMVPRANLTMEVNQVRLDDSRHLLRVVMDVTNVGKVRLHTHDVDIFVYQIRPLLTSGNPPSTVTPPRSPAGEAYKWPVIMSNEKIKLNYIFDPGECGPIVYEAILDKLPDVALVYVNILYDDNPNDGWDAYKVVEFAKDGSIVKEL